MSTFFFETITDAQASAYNAATDNLVFGTTGERANITTVRYNPATATSAATITVISGLTGKTVTFASTLANDTNGFQPIFPDGSQLFIGTSSGSTFNATTGAPADPATGDGLYGGAGDDSLNS